MMDYRIAVLLQTFSGLKLSLDELKALMRAPPLIPRAEMVESLSEKTREFLARQPWEEVAEKTLTLSRARGVRWSFPGQPDFPPGWYGLSRAPLLFSYIGRPVWLEKTLISIVGSRTPMTESTLWMQRELPRFLSCLDVAVVSGGARGVDQWAHRLALAARRPTVVVFPSGILNPYPHDREDLWESVLLEDGCLLSTFALGEPIRKQHFHTRNRWIAGLSELTFVVEGNRRSGSLLTAALALEEGRTVAAIPVSPYCAQGQGGLDLIVEGGIMIRDAGDLIVAMSKALEPISKPHTP
jgi:DNA processing protein